MALLDILFERKQKKENIEALDVKNLDANDGDSVVVLCFGESSHSSGRGLG